MSQSSPNGLFIASFLLLAMLLSGCGTAMGVMTGDTSRRGKPIDRQKTQNIQDYSTTKQQVLEWFGPPRMSKQLANGSELWTYVYRKTEADLGYWLTPLGAGGSDTAKVVEHQTLEILIRDDIVIENSYSEQE